MEKGRKEGRYKGRRTKGGRKVVRKGTGKKDKRGSTEERKYGYK